MLILRIPLHKQLLEKLALRYGFPITWELIKMSEMLGVPVETRWLTS